MTGRVSRWMVSVLLRRIRIGRLVIVEGRERRVYGSGAPVATVRVLALIYAHALGTALAGAPVHPHPKVARA